MKMRLSLRVALPAVLVVVANTGFASPALAGQGDLDSSFGTGGSSSAGFGIVANVIAPDGKHVVVGDANSYTGNTRSSSVVIARFNPDGTLDQSFGSNGKTTLQLGTAHTSTGPSDPAVTASSSASALALQRDGRVVVVGTATDGAHRRATKLFAVRLSSAGQLDPTFGTGGAVLDQPGGASDQSSASGVIVLPNGSNPASDDVVLVGTTASSAGAVPGGAPQQQSQVVLERYDSAGAPLQTGAWAAGGGRIVTQFGQGPPGGAASEGDAIAPEGTGFVIAGGATDASANDNPALLVAAFNGDGSERWAGVHQYATGGGSNYSAGLALALDPVGRIDVGGFAETGTYTYAGVAARFNADGSPDGTFGPAGQNFWLQEIQSDPNNPSHHYFYGNAIAVASNGDVVLAGQAGSDPEQDRELALVTFRSGSRDACFGQGGVALNAHFGGATALAVQADGKLVLSASALARLLGPGVGPCGDARGGAGGGAGNRQPGQGSPQLERSAAARTSQLPGRRIVLDTGILVRCPADASRCTGVAVVMARLSSNGARAASKRTLMQTALGRATFSIQGGRALEVRIILSKKGAKLLRKLGSVNALISVSARSPNGLTTTMKRSATLRVPGKRHRRHG